MAHEDRPKKRDLNPVVDYPSLDFDFFQAVRRLEHTAKDGQTAIGESRFFKEDIVRFGQKPTLASENGPIAAFTPSDGSRPAHMLVHFLGLLGPSGPLPLHLTELVIDWENERCRRVERLSQEMDGLGTSRGTLYPADEKARLAHFFDIFHHRLISLFYRAWAIHQQTVSFGRTDDPFGRYIESLIGCENSETEKPDDIPHVARYNFSGYLSGQPRPPEGLEAILKTYFGVEAKVIEFVGEWVEIPRHCRCRLGAENHCLGENMFLGDQRWEAQHKFRVRLGPMNFRDYEQMLPGGKTLPRLVKWVRAYVGDALSWDLQIILAAETMPDDLVPRLGYTSWLGGKEAIDRPDDMVFRPLDVFETNRMSS